LSFQKKPFDFNRRELLDLQIARAVEPDVLVAIRIARLDQRAPD
jgi:hypothetical protein